MTKDSSSSSSEAEVNHLHQCLFGTPAPTIIAVRYNAFLGFSAIASSAEIDRMVRLHLDVEAVATALRFSQRHHPLLQRFHGLYYLCETHPDYWGEFYNDRRRRSAAWLRLLICPVRTAWLLAKGVYLIRRHHLV